MEENTIYLIESLLCTFRVSLSVLQEGPSHSSPPISAFDPLLSSKLHHASARCCEGRKNFIPGSTLEDDSSFLKSQRVLQIFLE